MHGRILRLALVFLSGCAVGGALLGASPARALAAPLVRLIAASTTDPAIDDVNGVHHVAIGPAESRLGRLFVFLPGTGASAQMYSALIERAAILGYHAIGLAYVNEVAVNAICAGVGAAGCHENVRLEVLLGTDTSPLVEVDADNGAFHRLDRLLEHLEGIAPNENWEAYRDASGEVRWSLVTVAGHSQGAGQAAFTARLRRVARAVLFSGTEPAPWTEAGDFATPAEDFYGFAHRLEPIYDPIQRSWENIGLPGVPTSVDAALPPFGGSHQLHSSTEDCTGDPGSNGFYHNCLSADGWMPLLPDGTPAFQYFWDHLFAFEAPPTVPAASAAPRALLLGLIVASGLWLAKIRGRSGGGDRQG
jgi:hypothetical protein